MNKRKWLKKLPKAALCILLVFAMLATDIFPSISAQDSALYLEDIRIYTGGSSKDAKSYFQKIGYEYLDADLNPGTGTGKYVYLGYKTTEDRDKAITSLRLMPMQGGYQINNYDDIMAYMASESADVAAAMTKASDAFVVNYKAGSPRAIDAYLGLNMFYLSSMDNMLLGDYIVSGRADQAFYSDILVKASSGASQAISNLLNIGLTPFENAYDEESGKFVSAPWASLIPTSGLWQMYREGMSTDDRTMLARLYGDQAVSLFHSIQEFTANYENALSRLEFSNGALASDLDIDSVEEGGEALGEAAPEDADAIYIAAYEMLNSYDFDVDTKLGDWFLELGHLTSDTVDYTMLYPILESMGEGLANIMMVTGFISVVMDLGENETSDEYRKAISELEGVFGTKGVAVVDVFANIDSILKGKTFAYTSEAVRRQNAENEVMSPLEQVDQNHAALNDTLKKIGFVVGIGLVVVGALAAIAKVGLAVTVTVYGTAALAAETTAYAFFSTAVFYTTGLASFLGFFSLGVLAVTLLVALGFYLYKLFMKENKAKYQTEKPDFYFDAVEYKGTVSFVLYECALDDEGKRGDINAAKQWKWVELCFSRDKGAGSPIVADENGKFFKAVKDNPNPLSGYDCVRHFGERGPADFNANCDKGDRIYVHYTTEDSLAERTQAAETPAEPTEPTEPAEPTEPTQPTEPTEPTQPTEPTVPAAPAEPAPQPKQYIQDIIIGIGKDAQEAKNAIIAHENKFYVLDYNLSPSQSTYTYLGYTLTENSAEAITDLRIAPYAGGPEMKPVMYGDIQYNQIGILGYYVGKGGKQGTPAADALFYTRDKNAGSPIPVDGLHPVKTQFAAEEGWEPVSYFGCDVPYNFDSKYEMFDGAALSYFGHNGGFNLMLALPRVYLYYEPSEKFTSGVKYLSGMFFAGGYDILETPEDMNIPEYITTNTDWSTSSFLSEIKLTEPRSGLASEVNLSSSIRNMYDSSKKDVNGSSRTLKHGNLQQFIGYTWTYNPKRAVSNLALYQGDTFSNSLPYMVSKPNGSVNCNYVAAINRQQQYTPNYKKVARFVSPSNTFMSYDAAIPGDTLYRDLIAAKTTNKLPEGIEFGCKNIHFLPTGLYVSGYVKGMEPLKLEDVIVITDTAKAKAATDSGYRYYTVSGKTLAGNNPAANQRFRPIADLKGFYTGAMNLSYPDCVYGASHLYLFLKGQQEMKKTYISSLSVGSFSRAQYKEVKSNASGDELKVVDSMVNNQAMLGAIAGCSNELIVKNIALTNPDDAWYNRQSTSAPKDVPAAYIGVTRTESAADAIKGVILYRTDLKTAPNTVDVEKVKYTCAGVNAPIFIDGQRYYLYYAKNTGAIPGAPIKELVIDDLPIIDGAATNLCAGAGTGLYGNTKQSNYIHLVYDQNSADFYNKLYIGKGADEKAAMLDLLAQGCVQYVKINLNKNLRGGAILLGYRAASYDWDAINSLETDEEKQTEMLDQQNEAVYDIIVTKDEPYHPEGVISKGIYYYPVSASSLNAGSSFGADLYMYYATPFYSDRFNMDNNMSTTLPETVFTGCITRLAFAENERVPYTTLLLQDSAFVKAMETAAAEGRTADYLPWEYVMQIGDAAPADMNDGAIYSNGTYCTEARLHMFAQRSDGSVKPAGEITGGYVESSYDIGNLYINK